MWPTFLPLVALVEAPTFLATIQCFRLYGPTVLGVPVDATYIPRLGHGIDDTGIAMGRLALQRAFA